MIAGLGADDSSVNGMESMSQRVKGNTEQIPEGIFFMLSARQKIGFLNGGCDTCLTKKQSMPVRVGEHVRLLTGYVGEKLYLDLVSMSETIRGNGCMLIVEDSLG